MYILLLIILALVAWLVLQTQSLKRELLQIQRILNSQPSGQLAVPKSDAIGEASQDPGDDPASPEKSAEAHRLRTNLYSFNIDYDGPGKDKNT